MAVGVFIRSDKVLLKGKDPLFSQVRQTFCQCLLSASRSFAAYLPRALPRRCLRRAAVGERGEAETQVPSDEEAGTQWEGFPPPLYPSEVGRRMQRDAAEMGSRGLGIRGALETPTSCLRQLPQGLPALMPATRLPLRPEFCCCPLLAL